MFIHLFILDDSRKGILLGKLGREDFKEGEKVILASDTLRFR